MQQGMARVLHQRWTEIPSVSTTEINTKYVVYKFCPKCGEKLIDIIEDNHSRLQCLSCKFIFYQNSKPTVSALIINGDEVLLGKRCINPAKGMWDVPGGFLELGEHPEDGMRREAMEETGLEVEILFMLGIFMDEYGTEGESTLNICYVVKAAGGEERPGDDLCDLKWFSIADLPKEIAFKNGKDMLAKFILWHDKQEI